MDFSKKETEDRNEYICRICSLKETIGTWNDTADIIRNELGENFDESAYRKTFQSFSKIFDSTKHNHFEEEYIKELDEKKDLLYKQQVKTFDKMREYRKTLRDEARIEILVDAIRQSAESYPSIKPVYDKNLLSIAEGNEAILNISDWHVGSEIDNFRNKFNDEILENRVQKLMEQTVAYCKMANVTKLHIVNGGDMISGAIHTSVRVENELDVVEQVKKASSLIYQLLMYLSEQIPTITYRSTLDNHSRINKDYKEHIEKENYGNLISWWLESKLEGTRVQMMNDNIDENIGYFVLNNGKQVGFVHGHLDSINTVIQDLTFGTNVMFDIILMSHYHCDKFKSFQGRRLIVNGSLRGVDSYALGKRLFGDATQTLLIFNNKDIIDIRINL